MDAIEIAILIATAFATAMVSAIVGMAGGITLLAVMLLFMDPLDAIPVHGAIQLASNGSRVWIQRAHVRPELLWRYVVPLVPMGIAGLLVAQRLPPDGLRAVIGVFVLAATWSPRLLLLGAHPEQLDPQRRFYVLGAAAGFLNVTVGAIGVLVAPFFLGLGLTRFAVIGTMAACQAIGHAVKIGLFVAGGFAFAGYAGLLAGMVPAVVAGTWAGSRVLRRVDEKWFTRIYQTILTLVALRLVVAAV